MANPVAGAVPCRSHGMKHRPAAAWQRRHDLAGMIAAKDRSGGWWVRGWPSQGSRKTVQSPPQVRARPLLAPNVRGWRCRSASRWPSCFSPTGASTSSSPALPAIQESLALSATGAGLVFSVFFAGRLVTNLAGRVACRASRAEMDRRRSARRCCWAGQHWRRRRRRRCTAAGARHPRRRSGDPGDGRVALGVARPSRRRSGDDRVQCLLGRWEGAAGS